MPRSQHRDPTLLQVLSLYLLLLAFFVLLLNLSRAEEFRKRAVSESLSSAFAGKESAGPGYPAFTAIGGDLLADAGYQREIGELVKSAVPLAQVKVVKAGHVLRARLPVASLFAPRSPLLRSTVQEKLRRVAQALARTPPGIHYDLDIIFGTDGDTDGNTDGGGADGPSLPALRAGRFAQELQSGGAPPGTVAAGIERGNPHWVELVFRLRLHKEASLWSDPEQRQIP